MLQPIGGEVSIRIPGLRAEAVQHILSVLRSVGSQPGTVIGPLPDGQTELQIGDRFVSLFLGEDMEAGRTFTARLVEGRLILNLDPLPSQYLIHQSLFDAEIREPALQVTIRSLVQTLQDMGLSPDVQTLTLARAMVSAGFPLAAPVLEELRRRLDEIDGTDLPALVVAFRKGLPITRRVLDDLGRLLRARGDLSQALRSLQGALHRLPREAISDELRSHLAELEEWLAAEKGPLSPESLKQQVERHQVAFDAALAKGEAPGDLKALLHRVLAAVSRLPEESMGSPIRQEVAEAAGKAIDVLGRSQIENLPDQVADEDSLSVQLPVRIGDEDTVLELIVRRDRQQVGDQDEGSVELVIRVGLSAYGMLEGILSRTPAGLYVTLSSRHPDGTQVLEEHLEELSTALKEAGFSPVRVKVAHKEY
jgi:hypothetical protein